MNRSICVIIKGAWHATSCQLRIRQDAQNAWSFAGLHGVRFGARQGFTLVELLITTSLMALVGGATVASLAGGVKVWERAELGMTDQWALVAFTRMRRDLQNVRPFRPVPFDGTYDRYAFAAVDRNDPADSGPEEIGRLGYFLDEHRHLLCRSFTPYRLMRGVRLAERCHTTLEHVEQFRCRYFGAQTKGGEADWTKHWQAQRLPVAVNCDVTLSALPNPVTHSLLVYLGRDEDAKTDEE